MEPIRDARLLAALDRAFAGDCRDLIQRARDLSGLPGPRANHKLARAIGGVIAEKRAKGDAIVRELGTSEDEFARVVAAMTLSIRAHAGFDRKGALQGLQDIAEDARHHVRDGVGVALRDLVLADPPGVVEELAAWTDGYLQAHVALEALADRKVLDALPTADGLIARLDEAFNLADVAPRAAERSQGLRTLREQMPRQVGVFAARFVEMVAWVEAKADVTRPDSRIVVQQMIEALRKANLSLSDTSRLEGRLEKSAKPDRNAARIVHGTRKRSKR
jgi:hypothetical protein